MLPYTEEEIAFLRRHRISPDDVHDGRDQSKAAWQWEARRKGTTLVLGSPCRAEGHRLRTRAGHCVQCDPKKITFQRRYRMRGAVYIAGSASIGLIKIGTAEDVFQREAMLQRHRYGGATDWEVLASAQVEEGGRVEHETLTRLGRHRTYRTYEKDGAEQVGGELLRCPFSRALNALMASISDDEASTLWQWTRAHEYEFEDESENRDEEP